MTINLRDNVPSRKSWPLSLRLSIGQCYPISAYSSLEEGKRSLTGSVASFGCLLEDRLPFPTGYGVTKRPLQTERNLQGASH